VNFEDSPVMPRCLVVALLLAGCAAHEATALDEPPSTCNSPGDVSATLLAAVRSDTIEYGTYRPPDSRFLSLGRRVFVAGPPAAVTLARSGDPAVFDALLPLLRRRDQAWAAEVILSALTGQDAMSLQAWSPDEWWERFGPDAFERWQTWLRPRCGRLVWNESIRQFE
jgi:hypothetical protein